MSCTQCDGDGFVIESMMRIPCPGCWRLCPYASKDHPDYAPACTETKLCHAHARRAKMGIGGRE